MIFYKLIEVSFGPQINDFTKWLTYMFYNKWLNFIRLTIPLSLGGPPPAPAAGPPPAAPPPAAPPPAAAAAPRPIANLGIGITRVPELIRQKPLKERVYYKNAPPLKKKVYHPKEIDFDRSPLLGLTTVASVPFNKHNVRLDTPPGERERPFSRPNENDEEEERADDEESQEEDEENSEEQDDEPVQRKEQPRGFQKVPHASGWKKEETGDPNEKVYVLKEDYTYGDKPKK